MLPPDNFQEDPKPTVAHRTSPTNLGLYLLSAVSARDFGWAGTTETVDRLEATLATMGGLQRFRGHFYNWYDTRDLRPLDPQYVSSVDSGNLAGHLIALANACREWIGRPRGEVRELLAGIEDGLSLTRETLQGLPDDRRTQTITRHQLGDALDALAAALRADRTRRTASTGGYRCTTGGSRGSGHDHGRHRPNARQRTWRRRPAPKCCSGRRLRSSRSRVTAATLRRPPQAARSLERRLATLEATARAMADAMEFGFLLDPDRKLLSIGYRVAEGVSRPELLRPARLRGAAWRASWRSPRATFRSRHWFRLGRAVTPIGHGAALISWSGSMFEYLMPSLVMRAPAGSLLEQTSRLVVRRQITYGAALGVPWGISESAYNVRDLEFTYQYSNFGVPGLGSETRPQRERRRRALRDGARRHGRSGSGGAQLRPARRHRRVRPLRLLRGAGLHTARVCPRGKTSRSFAPSWRTIRA